MCDTGVITAVKVKPLQVCRSAGHRQIAGTSSVERSGTTEWVAPPLGGYWARVLWNLGNPQGYALSIKAPPDRSTCQRRDLGKTCTPSRQAPKGDTTKLHLGVTVLLHSFMRITVQSSTTLRACP
jgi:hypothetical protein